MHKGPIQRAVSEEPSQAWLSRLTALNWMQHGERMLLNKRAANGQETRQAGTRLSRDPRDVSLQQRLGRTHMDVLTVKAECPLSWKAVMGADMPSQSKNNASFYCLIWVFFHFMKSVHPQCAVAPVLYCPTLSKCFHFKQYSLFSWPSLIFLLSSQMCLYIKGIGRGEKS